MAHQIATSDILEVTLVTSFQNQVGENVLHYKVDAGVVPGPTALSVAQAIDAAITVNYITTLTNTASYRGCRAQVIFPTRYVHAIDAVGAAGTAGANPLPPQVRGLMTMQTDFGGRAFRGRMFFPFPDESHLNADATPNAGYTGAMLAVATSLFTTPFNVVGGGGSAHLIPIIWHRKAGKSGSPLAHTGDPITTFSARSLWATQRRSGELGRPNVAPF